MCDHEDFWVVDEKTARCKDCNALFDLPSVIPLDSL